MTINIYFFKSDFLWADPCENDEEAVKLEWSDNATRGCSYVFG
jgi:hypothetical protein